MPLSIKAYIRKEERSQVNSVSFWLVVVAVACYPSTLGG